MNNLSSVVAGKYLCRSRCLDFVADVWRLQSVIGAGRIEPGLGKCSLIYPLLQLPGIASTRGLVYPQQLFIPESLN